MSFFVLTPLPYVIYQKATNYGIRLCKRGGFLHELLLNHVTLYQKKHKRLKIEVFEPIGVAIFTHRHSCINKPC